MFSEKSDIEIISSPGEFESFISGSIHEDYLRELKFREEETVGLLEDPAGQYSGRDYDRFRGRLQNMRELKEIFATLMENKRDDLAHSEEEKDDA